MQWKYYEERNRKIYNIEPAEKVGIINTTEWASRNGLTAGVGPYQATYTDPKRQKRR